MADSVRHIILITTDQQRYDTLGCTGSKVAKTPNIDRLAKDGAVYSQAYSPNPACIPARANIVTGLPCRYHTFTHNFFHNETQIPYGLPTFPRLLSDHGWHTVAIGKMHFSPTRRSNGFDHMELMEEIPQYLEDDEYLGYLKHQGWGKVQSVHGVRHYLYMKPQQSLIPEAHHGSTWVADRSIATIRENHGTRPLLLWSSFIQPHPPFDVPHAWAHLYDDTELAAPYHSKTPISEIAKENQAIVDQSSAKQILRAKQLYYSAISFVDYQVGRIIDALKQYGMYDDSLIVFTSDHGEMFGDNDTFQKFVPYDGSERIPFVAKYPRGMKGTVDSDAFVDLNDLMPTFLDMAGIAYPANLSLPGGSLFQKRGKDRSRVFSEYHEGNKRWISMRTKEYKYTYYFGGGKEELFDMAHDPKEQENLLYSHTQDPKYRAIADTMNHALTEYDGQYGLEGDVVDGKLVVREPYVAHPFIERNFPVFPKRIYSEDRETMLSLKEEMELAVQDEPTVDLSSFAWGHLPDV